MVPCNLSATGVRRRLAFDLNTARATKQIDIHALLELLPRATRALHVLGEEGVLHLRNPAAHTLAVPSMLHRKIRQRISIVREMKTHLPSPIGELNREVCRFRSIQSVSRMYRAYRLTVPSSDRMTMS